MRMPTLLLVLVVVSTSAPADSMEEAQNLIRENVIYARSYFPKVASKKELEKIISYAFKKTAYQIFTRAHQDRPEPSEKDRRVYFQLLGALDPAFRNEGRFNHEDRQLLDRTVSEAIHQDLPKPESPRPSVGASLNVKQESAPEKLSVDEVSRIYKESKLLPSGTTHVEIRSRSPQTDIFEHIVVRLTLKNSKGEDAGFADFSVKNKGSKYGSELNLEQLFLRDRSLRGAGFAARFMLASIRLLKQMSDHPNSQIKLQAWTGYEHGTGQEYGGYIWAPYGFDYDRAIIGTEYHDKLAQQFMRWLIKSYGPERDLRNLDTYLDFSNGDRFNPELLLTSLTAKELMHIEAVVRTWKHPWEMALFDTRSMLGRPIGKFAGRLGKEFMTNTDERVRWFGHLYINRENDEGTKQFYTYVGRVLGCKLDDPKDQ